MSSLGRLLDPFRYIIRNQKKMIGIAVISAVAFSLIFFPYDDLSDLISELIAKNSQNQVFVQFDELGIGLFPPSVKMSNVEVDTPVIPTLKAGALYLAPSIAGFLAFSPGFSATIDEVFNGQLSVSYRGGKKINDTVRMQKVSLNLKKIDLKQLSQYASLPCTMNGPISAQLNGQVDTGFIEQPDSEYELSVGEFSMNPCVLIFGGLGYPVPGLKISQLKLNGTLKGGVLTFEDSTIGRSGDTLSGRFKGKIGFRVIKDNNRIVPEISSYELKIDLSFDKSAVKSLGAYLFALDSYKTVTGTGSRYALTLSAPNSRIPPTFAPLGNY